jgi:hypothetical protein
LGKGGGMPVLRKRYNLMHQGRGAHMQVCVTAATTLRPKKTAAIRARRKLTLLITPPPFISLPSLIDAHLVRTGQRKWSHV